MTTFPAKCCGEQQLVLAIYLLGFGGLGFFLGWFSLWEENSGVICEHNPAWLLCRLGKLGQSNLFLSSSGLLQKLDADCDLFVEYGLA